MKKFILPLLACFSLIGCEKESIIEPEKNAEFIANIEEVDTKTSLSSDNYIIWSESDCVSVFAKINSNKKYEVENAAAGASSCKLISKTTLTQNETSLKDNVAIYPYKENITIVESINSYTINNITFPSQQSYTKNSFAEESYPMIAVSSSTTLPFKNVGGAIMIQAKGDIEVASITLSGNKNEKLSGPAIVTASSDAAPTTKPPGHIQNV